MRRAQLEHEKHQILNMEFRSAASTRKRMKDETKLNQFLQEKMPQSHGGKKYTQPITPIQK